MGCLGFIERGFEMFFLVIFSANGEWERIIFKFFNVSFLFRCFFFKKECIDFY